MYTVAIKFYLFLQGARLSYIALFRWLTPPTYLASKILMPLSQLLFFTLLGIYATGAENSSFYVIGNAVHAVAVSGIFGVPMAIGDDRFAGTLPYLFGVPTHRLIIFISRALFHVFDGMLGIVISLLLGGWLFGLDVSQADFLTLLLTIAVISASSCGLGQLLGSLSLITVNALFVGNTFYFILLALSGANVPLESLPLWLQQIAYLLPITRGLAATRQVINGASLLDVWPLLVGELLVGLAYTALGYLFFRTIEYQARHLGTLETV